MSTLPHALRRSGFLGLATGFALSASAATDPVDIYFLHQEQTVLEQGTVPVYLEMSTYPLTEVVIPFRFLDAESTATRQTLDADGVLTDGDYYLAEDSDPDDGNGLLFDPATGEGSLTWLGYPSRRFFPLTLSGDDVVEGNETIVLEIDPAGLIGAVATNPSKHTIVIQDDDDPDGDSPFSYHAYFERTAFRASESGTVTVPVKMLSASTQTRRITWQLVYSDGDGMASAGDISIDDAGETPYSADIAAGSSQGSISVAFVNDLLEEGDETFGIRLTKLEYLDADSNPVATDSFTLDPSEVSVLIEDDDPTTVQIDSSNFDEQFWNGVTFNEGESGITLTINLSAPVQHKVEIPLLFSGTATRGTDDAEGTDWIPSPDPVADSDVITIAAGSISQTIGILINNDIVIEGDGETVVVTLGTPQMVEESTDSSNNTVETRTDLPFGSEDGFATTYTITIDDNDPVDIGFGQANPALLLEDPDEDEPRFVFDNSITIAEGSGGTNIPIFASGNPAVSASFEIQVVSDGTTAQMLDINQPADEQDWDFYVTVIKDRRTVPLEKLDESIEATFETGGVVQSVNIVLNNEEEPALPYHQLTSWLAGNTIPDEGDEAYSTIEQDETIRLRLVAVSNFDESGVLLRDGTTDALIENPDNPDAREPDAREFTITIKELPEIDLTAEFHGLTPLEDNFVDGNPPRDAHTRLHELHYVIEPSDALKADLLARRGTAAMAYADGDGSLDGYTAYKIAFQPGIYDLENPEAATNDRLRPRRLSGGQLINWEPDGFTSYVRLVDPAFSLRFPNGLDLIEIQAGVERNPDRPAFKEENAPITTLQPFLLRTLNLGLLDPIEGILREGHAELDETMDYLIEFSNGGKMTFGADQRARRLANTRVLLTSTSAPVSSGTSFNGTITGFEETTDGDIMLELYNPAAAALRIQYMDAEGEDAGVWKTAQPGLIRNIGTNFFWIDQGPPKTEVHPRDVNFRLYRISN